MSYTDESGGSWGNWANLLIKETQRFSSEIEKIQLDMKDFAKEVLQIQKDIITISSSKVEEELLKRDIVGNRGTIDDIKKDIDALKEITADHNKFKIQIFAGFTLLVFGVSVVAAIGKL